MRDERHEETRHGRCGHPGRRDAHGAGPGRGNPEVVRGFPPAWDRRRSDRPGAAVQPGAFYASGHPETGGNLGVLVSTDGAKTWKQVSAGVNGPVDFHSMDASPADPNVLYGHYGSIQVSRDAGKTWEITGRPPADTFDLAASAKDPNTVYAATRAGLMVSRDAGKTWQAASMVQRPATLVATTRNGTAYAFQVGTGLLRTTEPSMAWQTVSNGFGNAVLLHLAVDPTTPERLYAVTDRSAILASQDGGKTWKLFRS
jgi:photosystem II stability/assembly factor-like uncharacterized protein